MALGVPRLVTYSRTDGLGRIFELSGEVFVQVGNFGITHAADQPSPPWIGFNYNAPDVIGVISQPGSLANGNMRAASFGLDGTQKGSNSELVIGAGVNSMYVFMGFITGFGFVIKGTSAAGNLWWESAAPFNLTISSGPYALSNLWTDILDANGQRWVNITGTSSKLQVGGGAKDASFPTSVTWGGKSYQWLKAVATRDNSYWYNTRTNNEIQMWRPNTGTTLPVLVFTYASPGLGTVQTIVPSRNNRFVAVGYDDGTTKTTVILQRFGEVLREFARLPDMGTILNWTADGKYLIDSFSKKAYRYDGQKVFTDVSATMMVNVPANSVSQATSDHAPAPPTLIDTQFYTAGLDSLVQKTFGTLKVALLSNAAVFDRTQTTATTVLASQVTGGTWPAGGITLNNVTYVSQTNSEIIKADDLAVALNVPLTFRTLLIYDSTNNRPIMWQKFDADIAADADLQLNIKFSNGIVSFQP